MPHHAELGLALPLGQPLPAGLVDDLLHGHVKHPVPILGDGLPGLLVAGLPAVLLVVLLHRAKLCNNTLLNTPQAGEAGDILVNNLVLRILAQFQVLAISLDSNISFQKLLVQPSSDNSGPVASRLSGQEVVEALLTGQEVVEALLSGQEVVEALLFLADGSWSPGHEIPALAGLGEGHHVPDRVGPEVQV